MPPGSSTNPSCGDYPGEASRWQVEQVSAFQGVFNGFTHHSAQFYSAPNELASRGLRDRDALSHADRMLFDQLLANVLNQLEMSSWLIHAGLMQDEDVGPVDWWMENKLFCYPGARDWLAEYGPTTYPPAFFARMEGAHQAALQHREGSPGERDI